MGKGREGVLVRVLVGVLVLMLVLMLVLVELSAQVGRRAQRGAAVGALGGQETGVELLAQKVLLWRRRSKRAGLVLGLLMTAVVVTVESLRSHYVRFSPRDTHMVRILLW